MSNASTPQVVRNAAASYLTLLTQLVSGLVVTPLLFRSLGQSTYGTYALLVSLMGYVGLLELGIGSATLRLVAVAASSQAQDRISQILGSSRSLYVPVIAFSTLAYIPIAIYAPGLPGASGASPSQTRLVVAALALSQLFNLLMNVYPAYIYGTGRSDVIYTLGTATSVALAVAQIVVARTGAGIVALAAATAGVTVLNVVVLSRIARHMLGEMRANPRDADRATRRQLVSFGLKNAGVTVVAVLNQQLDVLVIGSILPAARVAAYALGARVASFGATLATGAMNVLVPTFADAAERGDETRQVRLVAEATLFGSALLYPLAAVCAIFGNELLRLWIGTVPRSTGAVLALLLAGSAIQVPGTAAFAFFNGRGELDIFLRWGAIVALANVGVSVVLALTVGVIGPAVATVAGIIAFDVVLLPRAMARSLGRRPGELFSGMARSLAPALLLSCGAGGAVALTVGVGAGGAVVGSATIVCVFYVTFLACCGTARRRQYTGLLRRGR